MSKLDQNMPRGTKIWMTISLIAVAIVVLSIVIMDSTPLKNNRTRALSFIIVHSLLLTSLSLGLSCVVGGIKVLHKVMAGEPAGKAILAICIGIFVMGVAIYGAFAIDVSSLITAHDHVSLDAFARGDGAIEVRVYDHNGNVFYDQDGRELWLVCDEDNVVKMKDGYVVCSRSDYDSSIDQDIEAVEDPFQK